MKSILLLFIVLPIVNARTFESSGTCPESIYHSAQQSVRINVCTDENIVFGLWDEVSCPIKRLDFSKCHKLKTVSLKYRMDALCSYIEHPYEIKWSKEFLSSSPSVKVEIDDIDIGISIEELDLTLKQTCDDDYSDETIVTITMEK